MLVHQDVQFVSVREHGQDMLDQQTIRRLRTVQLKAIGADDLPVEVQHLLGDDDQSVHEDVNYRSAALCERLIADPTVIVERTALARWLLACDLKVRLLRGGWRLSNGEGNLWEPPYPVASSSP